MANALNPYTTYAEQLFWLFADLLEEERLAAGLAADAAALAAPALFDKWLRSTVADGTLLSPLNLLAAYETHCRGRDGMTPYITREGGQTRLRVTDYGGARHPIVEDFRRLADAVGETSNLAELRFIQPTFLAGFTAPDFRYLAYLTDIAGRVGLLKAIPSLNARVVCAGDRRFLDKPSDEILRAVVDATLAECVARLAKVAAVPRGLKQTLHGALASPVSTGELFHLVADGAEEMNPDRMMSAFEEGGEAVGDLIAEMVGFRAAMARVGMVLERWFFTPMDSYLRLIRPAFLQPADLSEDVRSVKQHVDEGGPPETFSLCPGYALTALGRRVLNADGACPYDLPPAAASPEALLKAVTERPSKRGPSFPRKLLEQLGGGRARIVSLELREVTKNQGKPVVIEIAETAPLRELYTCVCVSFGADPFDDYAVFTTDDENPFTAYSTETAPIPAKPAENANIQDLALTKDARCKLVAFGEEEEDDRSFALRALKVSPGRYGYLYPRQA